MTMKLKSTHDVFCRIMHNLRENLRNTVGISVLDGMPWHIIKGKYTYDLNIYVEITYSAAQITAFIDVPIHPKDLILEVEKYFQLYVYSDLNNPFTDLTQCEPTSAKQIMAADYSPYMSIKLIKRFDFSDPSLDPNSNIVFETVIDMICRIEMCKEEVDLRKRRKRRGYV